MNGTSAASPVCAGVVALHLESVPGATSRDVKDFLNDLGKVEVGNDLLSTVSQTLELEQHLTGLVHIT